MGKRYYCDYCDASFPDSKEGRKKHNAGLVHQRMKETHFRQFTDARTRLSQELQKTPCRRFQQGMECHFGDGCRFSHLQPHEMEQLRYNAHLEEMASVKLPSQLLKKEEPSVEEFVKRIEKLVKEKEVTECNSWASFQISEDAEPSQVENKT